MCQKLKNRLVLGVGKRPLGPSSGEGGFSLVEVLIAMFLLAIGMSAWMQLQITAIKVNEASKKLLIAQDKFSQEMDQIKTIGYTGVKSNAVLTNASFNYSTLLTGLASSYQLSGIDTSCNAPAAYCLYKGLPVTKVVNGTTVTYNYTMKLAVNTGYLTYPEIAQVIGTIYWQSGSTLKQMQIYSYVGM